MTGILLDKAVETPLYRQLYERLRSEILAGQLDTGARLPSTRVLANELGVSRNTTVQAYELLQLEGYVESKVGAGTRVARLKLNILTGNVRRSAGANPLNDSERQPEALAEHVQLLLRTPFPERAYASLGRCGSSPFRVGQPDVGHFPYQTWARLLSRHARQSLPTASQYQSTQGYSYLRQTIAAHIGVTRGVHCSPEQIIMTTGTQAAFDLIARVVLSPGESAWVEDPGYSGIRGALLGAGAELVGVPVDSEGMLVESGRKLCRHARLASVTPSHQFPTGVTMSLRRRLELLKWAAEERAWIVEDDYDSEYRFGGRPLEALQGQDTRERVLYVGTFSKVLFPSLRLGYLVAPAHLMDAFIATRRFIDLHLPVLEQIALADFIAEGHLARHLQRMRKRYLERRDALVDSLRWELGDFMEIGVPLAGMHLAGWLPAGKSGKAAVQKASAQGVDLLALSNFSLRPMRRDGLLFGFSSASPEELRVGARKLARAWL